MINVKNTVDQAGYFTYLAKINPYLGIKILIILVCLLFIVYLYK